MVKPGSKTTGIQWQETLFDDKVLILKILERPIDGEANKGVIKALSDFFDIPKSRITILRWHTSREKVIEIDIN